MIPAFYRVIVIKQDNIAIPLAVLDKKVIGEYFISFGWRQILFQSSDLPVIICYPSLLVSLLHNTQLIPSAL